MRNKTKFNIEEMKIRREKEKVFMLSFDRHTESNGENKGNPIRDKILTFIDSTGGKTFMCPVQSTLLFNSTLTLSDWLQSTNKSQDISDIFMIIVEINLPENIDEFYAKCNSKYGDQLLEDLKRLKIIKENNTTTNVDKSGKINY